MLSFSSCLLAVASAQLASASLFPTFPTASDSCVASKNCQLKWTDSKDSPSTSTLGQTAIDLVTGDASNLQLIQRLGGVEDPSKATAFTFVPQANLSSTAKYAVRFLPAKGGPPIFSTYFSITGGSGTAVPISSIAAVPGSAPTTGSSTPPSTTVSNSTAAVNGSTSKTASLSNNSLNSVNSTTPADDASKSSAASLMASLYSALILSAASLIYVAC